MSMKKMRSYLLSMLVLASITVLVACSFQESANTKLVKAFVNTSKKMNADFNTLKKIAKVDHDFSKGSVQELTLRDQQLDSQGLYYFPIRADGVEIRFLDSIEQKMLQTSLSAYFDSKKINFFGVQIDDDKLKFAFPDISNHSFSLSSKYLGRDLEKISSGLVGEDFELDLSYSKLKSEFMKYGVDNAITNYKKTWEILFKDVEIKVEGDTYSCMVDSKNIKEAIKTMFPKKTSKNLMIDQFLFYRFNQMADEIQELADTAQIKVEAKLKGQYVESSKVTWVQDGIEVFEVTTGFMNISEKDNIWKDLKIDIYSHEYDNRLEFHNTGEFGNHTIDNKTSIRFNDDDELAMTLKLDAQQSEENLELHFEQKRYYSPKTLFEGKGNFVSDDKSFRIHFPNLKMSEYYHSSDSKPRVRQFSLTYMMSKEISDRLVFKNEKYLPDLTHEEMERYFTEIGEQMEDLFN